MYNFWKIQQSIEFSKMSISRLGSSRRISWDPMISSHSSWLMGESTKDRESMWRFPRVMGLPPVIIQVRNDHFSIENYGFGDPPG